MNTRVSIAESVTAAALKLGPHSDSPRLDAQLLLGKLLGLSRAALIARGDEPVAPDCRRAFAGLIARRAAGTPVAYLTGSREFWSLALNVTPAVLVPRPETETLVERALELKSAAAACSVLDLGTGSGAIALAIASERPKWRVTGVDVSPQALKVAARNSAELGLAHIEWRQGSWFDAVPARRFDLILANPPYIAATDPALAHLCAEPRIALRAGPTGLEALGAIIASAPPHLQARGWLVLEHGAAQARDVARLLKRRGFSAVRACPDSFGKARVTLATVHTQH
ncbi:MAG: peptide chain release factor N(5)-glutamine methyltransferase [Steroidobacteraceae bacterium]